MTSLTNSLGDTGNEDLIIMNDLLVAAARAPGAGGGSGGSGGGGSGGGGGGGGGGSSSKGDLYGDQYILVRDVDPTDLNGNGNGEPVLDDNGQPILLGTDGRIIRYVEDGDGGYEISINDLPYTQTVELERANVARAPDKVMAKSLTEALAKIEGASNVTTDPAGRILCDGVTIDSPLENLALYQFLMTAGEVSSWPTVVENWPDKLKSLVGDNLLTPAWDPSSLLGAAFSKESPISLDAVLYQNTTLGVNEVEQVGGTLQVSYFQFNDGSVETYNYDRAARYENVLLQWYEDTNGDPANLELVQGTVLNAVFNGEDWSDSYLKKPAYLSGVNDFAQAADDARAIINFMHEFGAVAILPPVTEIVSPELAAFSVMMDASVVLFESEDEHDHEESVLITGTQKADQIETGGGAQTILSGNGGDEISAGGGPDIVESANAKDTLLGGGGPDTLVGGNGKDVLVGGAGPDTLTGGLGADVFVYTAKGDAPAHGDGGHEEEIITVAEHDDGGEGGRKETITDFQVAIDKIDFSQLGSVDFFSDGPALNSVWVVQDQENTIVHINMDGGGSETVLAAESVSADMSIVLIGIDANNLTAENFIL